MQAGRFLELKQFTFVKEMTKYQLGYFKSCSVIRKEPLGLTGLRSTPLSSVDSFPSGIHTRLPCAGLTECHGFQWICLGNPGPPIHVWHHTSLCLLIFCISPPKQGIHPSLTFHTRSLRTCMTGHPLRGCGGLCHHLVWFPHTRHRCAPTWQPHRCHLPSKWCLSSRTAVNPAPSLQLTLVTHPWISTHGSPHPQRSHIKGAGAQTEF